MSRNLLSFSVEKLFSYFRMWMRIVLNLVMYINMKIMTFGIEARILIAIL